MITKCKALFVDGGLCIQLARSMCIIALLCGLCGCVFHHKQVGASMLDDKVTTQRVEAALKGNPDFQQVHVSTNDGEVTITGSVKNEATKKEANDIAKTVDHVTSVRNEVQVR